MYEVTKKICKEYCKEWSNLPIFSLEEQTTTVKMNIAEPTMKITTIVNA